MFRKLFLISCLGLVLWSCTKDFAKINVNPTAPSSVPLDYIFGQVQLQYAGSAGDPGYTQWRGNLIYCMPMMQQMASLGSFYSGDKYLYSATNGASGAYFGTSNGEGNYPNSVKNMVNLISLATVDSATNVNILNMTRILKVLQMSAMTDLYGDVPYFQAGLGYLGGIYAPPFDKQSDIYPDMLNQLDLAAAALNPSAYTPTAADFSYDGDITKWKKFAYSLMLRLAMRLQKVDPAMAQTYVGKAFAGGVMASNADSYMINYTGGSSQSINPVSFDLGPSDNLTRGEVLHGNIQWSNTFIDAMKSRNDPRLGQIASVGQVGVGTGTSLGDTVAAHQVGLPNGLDQAPAGTSVADYSVMNILTYQSNSPLIILTYAEVEFLTAEAIERGWATGSATSAYQNGQQAALQQMASFNASFMPTAASVSAYQTTNPYPASGTLDQKMNQIETEKWLLFADTYNGYESFADWRRTGFPVLTPINYTGNATNGTVPRRLIYPTEQITLSAAEYQQALTNQGPDLLTTRMWWDKQ